MEGRGLSRARRRLGRVFGDEVSNFSGRAFRGFIFTLIVLNVLAVVFETVESVRSGFSPFFRWFEVFSVAVFTAEYLLRLWACAEALRFSRPLGGRVRFALTPMALVDLIAILPFYLPFLLALDLRFVRVLRLFRLFRVFKMGRYSESMRLLGRVLSAKKEELYVAIFCASILLVLASGMMYFLDREAQPKLFSSIPAAMWWGMATLTTVGYGDVYPVTGIGKILGGFISLLGIGMFALPAGILGSGFVEEMQKNRGGRDSCPHCGKAINPSPS